MPPDVVAFVRRDRVVLAAVLGERGGTLDLVAEDGARFALDAAQVVCRCPVPGAPSEARAIPGWLREVRRTAAPGPDWEVLHATLAPESCLSFESIAAAAGATEPPARLALALALGNSAPWLHRDGPSWRVVRRERALARRDAEAALRRAEAEDAAFLRWWPRRSSEAPPGDAEGALEAARRFALLGETPATERGRRLAGRVDLHEADPMLEALVACGALAADVNPAPYRAGLDRAFPRSALDEAGALVAGGAAVAAPVREDLTGLFAVTVDDAETTEVDDALSIRRTPDGWELLVHISDVAAAIGRGSALDRAAEDRGSSLYLPEFAIPMLPPDLVASRLSLELGSDRDALTGVFRLRDDGTVAASRFVRSRIRVARRLTYEQTLDPASMAATEEESRTLLTLGTALRDARVRAGAAVASLASLKVTAQGGVPHVALRHQATPGDVVVAEAAVLHNCEAGRVLAGRDFAAFFRVQGPPRDAPAPDHPLLPVLLRRRFAPTHLAVEAARHHGIGADHYAQASSPIRRFADLVNQRQLAAAVEGRRPEYLPAELETMARHVSERERAVRRASDERTDHWIARWMEPRRGAAVRGILVRPPRRGLGSVWVPELVAELPLRAPDSWVAPPEGTETTWVVERVLPWRGRIELAPAAGGAA